MAYSDPLWPSLPLNAWQDTYLTLQLFTQIVGKVRMTMSPPLNHWWHATLYVNARGLTTSPIPFPDGVFEIQFNFVEHTLEIYTSGGGKRVLPLQGVSVADFYASLMRTLHGLGINVAIQTKPQEMAVTTPLRKTANTRHTTPNMSGASFKCWFRRRTYCRNFADGLSGSPSWYTFSGAASTSLARGLADGRRRRARV